jgi:hypothetical protein
MTMNKTTLKHNFFRYSLLFFLFVFTSADIADIKDENWSLLLQKDGVDFFVATKSSKVSPTLNLMLKVVNTTSTSLLISFAPSFTCQEGGAAQIQPTENTYLSVEHNTSLHSYKVCNAQDVPQVKIEQLQIEKK